MKKILILMVMVSMAYFCWPDTKKNSDSGIISAQGMMIDGKPLFGVNFEKFSPSKLSLGLDVLSINSSPIISLEAKYIIADPHQKLDLTIGGGVSFIGFYFIPLTINAFARLRVFISPHIGVFVKVVHMMPSSWLFGDELSVTRPYILAGISFRKKIAKR